MEVMNQSKWIMASVSGRKESAGIISTYLYNGN